MSVNGEQDQDLSTPSDLLRLSLGEIPGIQAAFIYGSFARRNVHAASDVDVFILGESMDRLEVRQAVAAATLRVSGILGREVNATRFTPTRLAARYSNGQSNQFIGSILSGEKEWLIGDESMLRELIAKVV